ncbi:hypothetical protein GOP47_0020977 [Adiantum capillus-veneris]|uniref:SHSP domain-containing protein n=1 Tax=Adiantum capillus-veneris TaxID=13818 RepID=A0A9D4UAL0_ADICA|nr:hypothetical protein GOP47_0020977 [Adiantum capillus-veneris]
MEFERRNEGSTYVYTIDLSGLPKDQVKVSIYEGRTLRVRGGDFFSRFTTLPSNATLRVRAGDFFSRSTTLPSNADVSKRSSEWEDDKLVIKFPKINI